MFTALATKNMNSASQTIQMQATQVFKSVKKLKSYFTLLLTSRLFFHY